MNTHDVQSEFQGTYSDNRRSTRYIAVHHAAAVYPGQRGIDHVRSAADYHVRVQKWPGIAYHICLAEEVRGGPIARYNTSALETRRFHAASQNSHALGVCCLTDFGNRIPEDKWIAALAEVLRDLKRRYPDAEIVGHRDIVENRTCPGTRWSEWKGTLVARVQGDDTPPTGVPAPDPVAHSAVLAGTPLLVSPVATPDQCSDYMLSRPTGEYNEHDVREVIVPAYFRICAQAGLNPLLAIAQMIHETGNLTSWWSQRPRRNPAGIGVTGETRRDDPGNADAWAWNEGSGVFGAGLSFPTWEDHAIPAHVGRLLAYAVPSTAPLTAEQRQLIDTALRARPLPERLRGAAPTLEGLVGTWAVPGRQQRGGREVTYAELIAEIANRIVSG